MIVDPSTGMPVEQGESPQSMAGTYGSTLGQSYGVQMPLYYDAMSAIPTATSTMAWNMGRVRSTIMNNRSSASNAGGLRQTFSPLRFNSLASLENIDPSAFGTTRKPRGIFRGQRPEGGGDRIRRGYTPFNFLSDNGNRIASSRLAGSHRVAKGTQVFAPGTLGTMTTMSSIASGNLSAKKVDNVIGAIGRFQKASGVTGSPFLPFASTARSMSGSAQGQFLSSALGASRFSNIKYAGNVAGYYQGAQAARTGNVIASRMGASSVAGEAGYFGKGMTRAVSDYAGSGARGGQALARFAGSRGAALGLKAVPYVGQALIIADITRFLGKSVGRGLKLGVEGIKSAQGDLIKNGPMGMGYKDNSVAATSRQRGVMAISNSRLNARSFLGQEAAFVHQNFG